MQIWSPHYSRDKHLLEKVQHRFTRMVPGMKVLPYKERLRQLSLWTLEEQVSQLKQGLADRTAKTAVSVAI